MRQKQIQLTIPTNGNGFYLIDEQVQSVVNNTEIVTGICNVFIRHTSASLVIQENADPAVLRDLERWMSEMVPESRDWEHCEEGPDDMPAHVRSLLTATSLNIPVADSKLCLGTWQGLFLWEHRAAPNNRQILIHVLGD